MRYFLLPITLLFLAVSCTPEPNSEPLEAARQKLAEASSVAFEMQSVWNNTFVQDTTVNAPHRAHYVKNDRDGFAYDFVYEAEAGWAHIYKEGKLEEVSLSDQQLTTFTAEEAAEDLAYEGKYASMMSPMEIVKDSAWQRAGKEGNLVWYEKVAYDEKDEDGHAHTFVRLTIDSLSANIVRQERIYTLDGAPKQHIIRSYTAYHFNEPDSLFYLYPEGLSTITKANLDKQQENEGLQPGDAFPLFDLVDIDGKAYSSESTSGKKRVFVFSFIGCGGCEYTRKELAEMEFELKDEYIGFYLNPTNSEEQIISYHADKPWPFKMATTNYDFAESCGVFSYPTFITVDESGKVLEVVEGYEEAYFADKGNSK